MNDSFSFAKDVLELDASLFMTSFDKKSLFTNIPLEIKHMLPIWVKVRFIAYLKLPCLNHFLIFDGKFYEQCDGVAMGSPLGPTLANVYMCHFENIWLGNYPAHYKPTVYRRFVDDTFLLFRTKYHVEKFKNYINKQHKNIKFTSEIQKNDSLSFLDITITPENNEFVTSVYRKPTFNRVFTNFERFIPDMYKRGLIELCFIEVLD